MPPAVPNDGFLDDADLPVEGPTTNNVIQITGKVIYVELLGCQELCFKLTDETIEAL